MKLLLPRERVSTEQQVHEQLVKEETKLSSRVDSLRELEASQVKKLQDFQEREFRVFQAKKEAKELEIKELDGVIESKKKEIEAQFGPLDKQWALFKQVEKKKIEDTQSKQLEIAADLFLKAEEQKIKDEELKKKDMSLTKKRSEILALSDTVKKDKQKAEQEVKTLKTEATGLWNEAKEAKDHEKRLEEKAQVRLREVEIRDEALAQREKELEARETAVLISELKYYSPVQRGSAPTQTDTDRIKL